ncbi:MAG: hypothetical protein CYPHOPRED_000044 [Cyphobasidiales sp. Tagirdzhanova-0007]|nr:MAG: hypothetical protein CYPHOPRED_000044 [Cyphobasidiales sp. Tagirdzhanova-0007]
MFPAFIGLVACVAAAAAVAAKDVAIIPPSVFDYTGPMFGELDSDTKLGETGCNMVQRGDLMWLTWPQPEWDSGRLCGACLALMYDNPKTGKNSTVYVEFNTVNGMGSTPSQMDTSRHAIELLGGPGTRMLEGVTWGFVDCVDAGLETGKLEVYWGANGNAASADIQVRGNPGPIKLVSVMGPDSCDWVPMNRTTGWWYMKYQGAGPFDFLVEYYDGTSATITDIPLNSRIGSDKGVYWPQ